MATVAIGSLRIDLALATAKFKEGAKKAQEMSKTLADRIKRHAQTIKNAFKVAAASAAAFAAGLALAVRGSLKEFDKLAKLSRAIGVPVEQLSALQHAADLSGVSIDALGKAFQNTARNMQDAAKAPNDYSRALDSLGISFRDANGNFRQANEVMLDVADKFKGMEDGAGKTALAMKIFGQRAGPQLISMLNQGSDGIKQATDEAERFGLVVSTKSAQAAEDFNDNVRRLGLQITGFSNRLTEKLLPALNHMAKGFLDWATEVDAAKSAADFFAAGINNLIRGAYGIANAYEVAALRISIFGQVLKGTMQDTSGELERLRAELAAVGEDFKKTLKILRGEGEDALNMDAGGVLTEAPIVKSLKEINKAKKESNDLDREAERLKAERQRIMEQMRTPEEAMAARQKHLNELFQGGAKDAETYGRAMAAAAAFSAKNMEALASTVSSVLGQIFGESKAAAIAQALISTYAGIAKAIETYPPPISTAMAAVQAAAGFAQVANIRKQTKSGAGGGGSSGGGGGGAAAATVPQQQQSFNITLQGEKFGRDQVRGLIESINDAVSDGAVLRVNPA